MVTPWAFRESIVAYASCLLLLALWLPGCAVSTKDAISYHTFEYPTPSKEARDPIPETLMVYQFLLDSSVDNYALVITQTKGSEQSARRQRWQDNPADMITNLILRDFGGSGLFARTVDMQSRMPYRYAIEGTVRSLRGIETDGKAMAGVELEVVLIDFEAPMGMDKTVLKQVYKAEVPAAEGSPEAIVAALARGINEISQRIRNDIRAAIERRHQPR